MVFPLIGPTEGEGGGPRPGAPGGGSPLPGGRPLPPAGETERIELLSLGLDAPVPLAYGRHFVGGTIIFEQENADGTTTLFIALGEGEWDAIEVLWVNGLPIDTADTSIVHFHPGLEGELGVESAPGTRNQKICSFLPTGFSPQLTFSRTAYLALKLKPDQRAPGPEFDIRGIFRSLRVRDFNAAGFTGYDYSTNPARIALDLLLRRFLLPRGLLNETVPSIVTDRLDFSAWNNWKTACDFDIGGGVKRWEASVAFVQGTDLLRALEWLLLLGRGYLLERNGQFAPFHDEDRAALLTAGRDEIAADSLRLSQKAIRSLANLYAIRYRALNSGNAPGTISTSGINVTGVDTDFTQRFKQDMLIDLRAGAQKGEARRVAADPSSDTTMPLLSAFSADQAAGTLYGNPGGDFQPQLRELADEDHQDQIGRIIRAPIDLGNSTGERAERLGAYLKGRGIDLRKRASFVLLPDLSGANDLLPGDVITGPADLDYASTRLWEILEISDEPDGRRQVFCQEFSNSIFTDTAGPQQLAAP
ncbi:MAG: hypothetical protein ACE5HB_09915, partial [Terriglobia bacterium]